MASATATLRPCPACRATISDAGTDPAERVRCPSCGASGVRAVLTAADPSLNATFESAPTLVPDARLAAAPAPSMAPECLTRFEIVATLGSGSMGVVFLARERASGRLVAVKMLRLGRGTSGPGGSGPGKALERFRREAEVLARLSHPNVLGILGASEGGGSPYIVFEYVAGTNLRGLIASAGRLPVARAIELAGLLLAGLAHAHQSGVMHRDIKPDNVLLPQDGGLKIADFGLARMVNPTATEKLTNTGMIMGTPNYMSPEQARGGKATFFSDIYAAGIVLFEMLAGEAPFSAPTLPELLLKQVNEPVPDLALLRPDAPRPLVDAVKRALAKEPGERFASAAEFRAALA
jgi:serine/threonine protein kinase